MNNRKSYFVTLRKPLFCLLVMCLLIITCVWVSVSQIHCTSSGEECQEIKLDFLCPLPEKDYKTLQRLNEIIRSAVLRVRTAKKECVDPLDPIVDDTRLHEALNLGKKIISCVDLRMMLPGELFWHYQYINNNPCPKSVLKHFKDLNEISRLSRLQFLFMCTFLHNSFDIYEAQSDIDGMLQTVLLYESLCNSVPLSSFDSCKGGLPVYSDIVKMSKRVSDHDPVESQWVIKELLVRVKLRLHLMVSGLVYNARNDTIIAYPLLLQSGHKKDFEEALELVAYYNDIIESTPDFFDLENGTIYNLELSKIYIDIGDDSLIANLRFRKILLQINRDRFANLYQEFFHLLSESQNKTH